MCTSPLTGQVTASNEPPGSPSKASVVARYLEEASGEALSVGEGLLYPALYRMEKKSWIASEWRASELGRRAKFYSLTPEGRRQRARETAQWKAFADAVSRVLPPSEK